MKEVEVDDEAFLQNIHFSSYCTEYMFTVSTFCEENTMPATNTIILTVKNAVSTANYNKIIRLSFSTISNLAQGTTIVQDKILQRF